MKKLKSCEYGTRDCIHRSSFSSQLKSEPYKLECRITLGWKGLPVTNTLAYWTHQKLRRKLSNGNMAQGAILTTLHFLCNLQISTIGYTDT
jgi:hypothetical protein